MSDVNRTNEGPQVNAVVEAAQELAAWVESGDDPYGYAEAIDDSLSDRFPVPMTNDVDARIKARCTQSDVRAVVRDVLDRLTEPLRKAVDGLE